MFRAKLRQIISVKESPHRIASSFAIGMFIGMSPLLGIHTILGIAVAYLLRLNKFITLVGVFVTNPWTIVPIYSFGIWLGAKLMHIDKIIPEIDWSNMTFSVFLEDFGHLLLPFAVGSTVFALASAIISYIFIFYLVKMKRW
ncbi:MAG: hypothetical protein A2X59_11660 [Nitrospirae bacterium GWC2_42_7]|nr:MAG: hypothetical protein A2X59_11660 [Nitrospirae bacterium GWC2_42_7]